MGGNMGPNMGELDVTQMGPNMGMGYGAGAQGGARRPPYEINFSLNGKDSRRTLEREEMMNSYKDVGMNPSMGLSGGDPYGGDMGNMDISMGWMNGNGNMGGGMNNFGSMGGGMDQNINFGNTMNPNPNTNMRGNIRSNNPMNDFLAERGQIDQLAMINQRGGHFNPSISPNMPNFQQPPNRPNGGQNLLQDLKNMNSKDIQAQVDKTKNEIANQFGLDPKKIKKLSARELDDIINSIRKGDRSVQSKYTIKATSEENSDPSSEEEPAPKKKSKPGKAKVNAEDKNKIINLIKKLQKANDERETTINSNIKKDIISTSQKNHHEMDISCENYVEPEFYNDYMITIPEHCDEIIALEVSNLKFPVLQHEIKQGKNEFKCILNNDDESPKCFELDTGSHTIDEVLDAIQSGFEVLKAPLKISLDNDLVKIQNKNKRNHFELINDKHSLLHYLGFTEEHYKGKSEYTSNEIPILSNKVYMYIDLISKDQPVGTIDLATPPKILKHSFPNPPDPKQKDIIIQFKKTITHKESSTDLFDFKGLPHSLKLTFKCRS